MASTDSSKNLLLVGMFNPDKNETELDRVYQDSFSFENDSATIIYSTATDQFLSLMLNQANSEKKKKRLRAPTSRQEWVTAATSLALAASQSGQRQPKIGSIPVAECAQLLRFEIASHRSSSTAAVHAATALAPSQDGLGQWPHSLQSWRHQACHTARSPALSRRCCRSAANLPSRARHRCHFCSPTCRIGTAAAGWPRRRPRCDCPATGSVPILPPCTQ